MDNNPIADPISTDESKADHLKPPFKSIFNSTVLIAFIPAYIYFCCFLYELGYCSQFNIPKYLITPNLTTVLIFTTSIFFIFGSLYNAIGLTTPLFKPIQDEQRQHLRPIFTINGIMAIIIIIVIAIYPLSWTVSLILLGITLYLNFFTWGFPLIFILGRKLPFKERMRIFSTDPSAKDLNIFSVIKVPLSSIDRLALLIIVFIAFFSFLFGHGTAIRQNTFQVLAQKPNIVVLKKYDDLLICSVIDSSSRTINDTIILIKLNDQIVLRNKELGRLKVSKRSTF